MQSHLSMGSSGKGLMDKELTGLQDHHVYDLVPISSIPSAFKPIGSRWVYKVKADSNFKARLVVQGWVNRPE